MADVGMEFDAVAGMRQVTMTVRVRRLPELRLRVWLASWLLRAVSWVLGCEVEVEHGGDCPRDRPAA